MLNWKWLWIILCLTFCGCSEDREVALGTLEWDRIALPAQAAEEIVAIHVREGERVVKGQLLLQLDPDETLARLQAAEAVVARQLASLAELEAGPRREEIERARANLAAAEAESRDRTADYRRLQDLGKKDYVSRSDIDGAQAAAQTAQEQVRAAREQLLELERGTRSEEIEQGEAALAEARSDARAQRVLLEKLSLRAPRDGLVDSIPFKLGDEAPVGASLVILLTGETPYARVYVPQPLRLQFAVGQRARITLEGLGPEDRERRATESVGEYFGQVRMVRNEPSFTPYYALTGDDVSRLSYIAEIQLSEDAAKLPAGLPLRAEFVASSEANTGPVSPAPIPGNAPQTGETDLGEQVDRAEGMKQSQFPAGEAGAVEDFEDGK
ncbi:biotin/lipoyl-binding protein [Microbulbifer bruguierae]|uniref:Biotin/lipoyl-binding protein n=1 Tax=Microbulbifer bruguierae TaxID=3029061 RepID=A0ABY8NBC0_9GAMM|nr:biotin/lipoyl-binding protein [Microbulbifer bruguierae]WGL16230.1 biotin/lipoyl-binding protein [Microbulbifer bruguierae]